MPFVVDISLKKSHKKKLSRAFRFRVDLIHVELLSLLELLAGRGVGSYLPNRMCTIERSIGVSDFC